jgi:hypothetical protein
MGQVGRGGLIRNDIPGPFSSGCFLRIRFGARNGPHQLGASTHTCPAKGLGGRIRKNPPSRGVLDPWRPTRTHTRTIGAAARRQSARAEIQATSQNHHSAPKDDEMTPRKSHSARRNDRFQLYLHHPAQQTARRNQGVRPATNCRRGRSPRSRFGGRARRSQNTPIVSTFTCALTSAQART